MNSKQLFTPWPWQTQPDDAKDAESDSTNGKPIPSDEDLDVLSDEDLDGTDLNVTIECLLALRSVRDQFKDAGLDLLIGELEDDLNSLEKSLIDHLAEQREHQDGLGLLTVSVVGDFNSGKSTFINALLDTNICPVGDEPTTASITYFIHGDQKHIERELDGKRVHLGESEYSALARHKKEDDNGSHTFHISIDSPILEHIRLVDTPGFNAPPPNVNDTQVTENAVKESDVLFVLMDINKGNPSDVLLKQLDRLSQSSTDQSHQLVFLLLNKADAMPPSQRKEVKRTCEEQHGDRFRDVVLVSALQLNETKDESFNALDIALQLMLSAYKARDSFKENISATLTPQSYRLDISGNVYDVPNSNFELASREQLADMVKDVSAERHTLLERQFQRHTAQLREDWKTTCSMLDEALDRALNESSQVGGSYDETRRKNALEAIEKAKNDTLDRVREIFGEVLDKVVIKDQEKRGFWETVHYQIRLLHKYKAHFVMDKHDNWRRIDDVYQGLFLYLERAFPDDLGLAQELLKELAEELVKMKKVSLDHLRSLIERKERELEGEELSTTERDKRDFAFDYIIQGLNSENNEWILGLTQHLQAVIDRLNARVISITERSQSEVEDRTEELQRLQDRINNMKEHTP